MMLMLTLIVNFYAVITLSINMIRLDQPLLHSPL